MKLIVTKNNENYVATVVEIGQMFDIVGADRIKKTFVGNNPVIVSYMVQTGDKMVYFTSGTELDASYCHLNDLYDKPELNAHKDKKGFISSKRRVRAIKLKGETSIGILMPMSSIAYVNDFDEDDLKVGSEFNQLNDTIICKKYFVDVEVSVNGSNKPKSENKLKDLLVDGQFNFHFQTGHLSKNMTKVDLNQYVVITAKLHGSSAILSKVFIKKIPTFMEKLSKFVGVDVIDTKYGYIYSSGKPRNEQIKGVLDNYQNPNRGFYKENIWELACKDYQYALEDGISIYGELCSSSIQKGYDYAKLRQNNKNYTFVVYRITRTNESGYVDEFSWNQIEQYCKKYNLQTVPVYFKGKLKEFVTDDRDVLEFLSSKYLEKDCEYCENVVPNEGICVRIESGDFDIFKLKSNKFKLAEDKAQEKGESNIEDEQ